MIDSLSIKDILHNFSLCKSWEEKYLYIIELGYSLPPLSDNLKINDFLVSDCQSQVWIIITLDNLGNIKCHGDSDTAIIKGLIAILFIIYKGLKPSEAIKFNIYSIVKKLSLNKHLTPYRSQGLKTIIETIRQSIKKFLK